MSRPECPIRGCSNLVKKGRVSRKTGAQLYRSKCEGCLRVQNGQSRTRLPARQAYRVHKGDKCIQCGFIPEHRCQLDVDHIDGDHLNNSVDNLQTLCANCHRLKTQLQKDYLARS